MASTSTSSPAVATSAVSSAPTTTAHPWGPRPKKKDQRKADRLAAELESMGEHSVVEITSSLSLSSTTTTDTSSSTAAAPVIAAKNVIAPVTVARGPQKGGSSSSSSHSSTRRREKKMLQQLQKQAAETAAATGIIAAVTINGGTGNIAATTSTSTSSLSNTSVVSPAVSAVAGTTTTTTTTDSKGIAHTVIESTVDDDDDGEGDEASASGTASTPTDGVVDEANQGIYPLVRNKLPKSKADRRMDSDHVLLTDRFSSPEQKAAYEARVVEQGPAVSAFMKARLEREARKNWDMFYKRNTAKFFKDRHYIQREFSEIDEKNCGGERKKLVEVGCGCGNTLFPLLQDNAHLDFFGFDFAPRAVELLQERCDEHKISKERCGLSVCDIANEPFPDQVVNYDFATIMFVLSALEPATMPAVLTKTFAALKPGGMVYMRDYALYDMTQLRFKKGSKIGDNFYMRWDGTRSFFFTTDHLRDMFTAAGFEVTFLGYISKVVRNIKLGTNMQRTWVQIKARKPLQVPAYASTPTPATY